MSYPSIISTIAGNGDEQYSGDGSISIEASFNRPNGIAIDSFDNVYVADTFNNRIRVINAITNVITSAAGTGNKGYSEGDNAMESNLNWPIGIAIGIDR